MKLLKLKVDKTQQIPVAGSDLKEINVKIIFSRKLPCDKQYSYSISVRFLLSQIARLVLVKKC